ncbi:hypothetical protein DFH09DRAFT_1083516 [Mycena vulgaris]|nr:hypothetical protein DFH09DRAFT_1083516 [Mycena vulgaris]
MANRATACIQAFWLLDMATKEAQRAPRLWTCRWSSIDNAPEDLDSIQFWTHTPRDLHYMVPEITLWALRFIAAQNPPENTLKTVLAHFNPSDSALKDKSNFAEFYVAERRCTDSVTVAFGADRYPSSSNRQRPWFLALCS